MAVRAREPLRAAAAALRRGLASAAQESSAGGVPVRVHNPAGKHRVVVTKDLPGTRWMDILTAANCRVEARGPQRVALPPRIAQQRSRVPR